jgi:hypothetical protein
MEAATASRQLRSLETLRDVAEYKKCSARRLEIGHFTRSWTHNSVISLGATYM